MIIKRSSNISHFSVWTFILCLLLSVILVIHLLFGFISAVVLATVIVSIFSSAHAKLVTKLNNRPYLAASISTLLVSLCILIPLLGFVIALTQQGLVLFQATQRITSSPEIANWITSLRSYLDTLNSYLGRYSLGISSDRILKVATSFSQTIGVWVYGSIGFLATNILSLFLNFILTVALVFVFFINGGSVKHFILDLVPLPPEEKERIVNRFRELAFAVFVGNGVISLLEGLLGGLAFFFFHIPGALIWGVAMAITAFLPIVGSFAVVIPAAIYLFLSGNTWQAIAFFSFNAFQLILLETAIKPKLIGKKTQIHAILVFMSAFAGVQIYGPLGLFYGPLLVTVFLVLAEIYKEHYRDLLL